MNIKQVLAQLEDLGDERVRARNTKLGAGKAQYGVKLGDVRKLAKKVPTDHDFAMRLWDTQKLEARLLAILILKPRALSREELDRMVRAGSFAQTADWLNAYLVKHHPDRESLRLEWLQADDPWAARAGWNLTALRIAKNPGGLDPVALLDRIEAELGNATPEVQWTMNSCLAEIGIHLPEHRERAIAIGESLGVFRDYPTSKGCTSPFAPLWVEAMVARQG